MKLSAYLSIYNDWDLLAPSLQSVLPYIDELVVVDGGYSWMAAFQAQIGRNPERSEAPVHEILSQLTIPVRVITGIWPREIDKRLAGYRACRNRYVLRIDADEVLYFDGAALEAFFSAGAAVAEMDMPTYVAPGWIEGAARMPRQAFIFDREQVSAEEHLHHLWLILTADALPPARERLPVFPDPVAFNAHLTSWRTPQTAIQRACFYVLNWNRQNGVPEIPELAGKPLADVSTLLRYLPARDYFEIMLGNPLVAGHFDLKGNPLSRTPLSPAQEAPLLPLWQRYQAAHAGLNEHLTRHPRRFLSGSPVCIDLTGAAAAGKIVRDGQANFETSARIAAVRATLHHIVPGPPWQVDVPLTTTAEGNRLRVEVPSIPQLESAALRRVLELGIWLESGTPTPTLRCL